MSTELKPVPAVAQNDKGVNLTQYFGPARDGDRRRLQLTQGMQYMSVSKEQARKLAMALLEWAEGDRPDFMGYTDNGNVVATGAEHYAEN